MNGDETAQTETERKTAEILARHPRERSALIPILQDLQEELGYLSPEAMSQAAKFLRVPESVVYGVATFYSQFYFTPQGRHRVRVCQGTACHVRGAGLILEAVKRATGAGPAWARFHAAQVRHPAILTLKAQIPARCPWRFEV